MLKLFYLSEVLNEFMTIMFFAKLYVVDYICYYVVLKKTYQFIEILMGVEKSVHSNIDYKINYVIIFFLDKKIYHIISKGAL